MAAVRYCEFGIGACLEETIPPSSVDPAGHVALSLASGVTPDDVDLPPHGVDALGSHGLIGAAALEGGPALARLVKAAHFRLVMRQKVMNAHRGEIVDLLEAVAIPAVVLKGQSVARWYESNETRTSTDVDLLVPRARVEDAVEAISAYAAVTDVPPKGPEADKRHIVIRDRSGVSFILDLHWHLYSYHQLRSRADTALPEVWAKVERSDLGWDLPLGAEVTFLAAHAVLDHRFRLILFRDLAEVARSRPDWDEVGRFADRHGLRSITWAALSTAKRFAAAPVPNGVLDAMKVRSMPERAYETWLSRVDPVRFDGRSRHPLNLATVLLHDERADRIALAARAPGAFGRWKEKPDVTHRRGVKRALVAVTSNARRGAEVFGETLSRELRGRGWEVRFVCLSLTDGPTVTAAPVRGAGSALSRLSPSVISGLRAEMRGADVVLLNGSATLRYGAAAALGLLAKPGLVYSSIGEPAYWASSERRRAMQRALLRRVDLVGAVSEATMEQLETVIGLPANVIRYAPTGVDRFDTEARIHTGDRPLHLIWVGSLSHEKRPMLLFDVLDQMSVPVTVDVVGDGPLREEIVRRASGDVRVTIVGAVSDVTPLLRSADALLQTSATEGLPGVVMEAAAIGVPSVAFDVGGTGELVIDGATGRLIPDGDVAEMARALEALDADRNAIASLGAAASEHVRESFGLPEVVDRWEAILEAAMAASRR